MLHRNISDQHYKNNEQNISTSNGQPIIARTPPRSKTWIPPEDNVKLAHSKRKSVGRFVHEKKQVEFADDLVETKLFNPREKHFRTLLTSDSSDEDSTSLYNNNASYLNRRRSSDRGCFDSSNIETPRRGNESMTELRYSRQRQRSVIDPKDLPSFYRRSSSPASTNSPRSTIRYRYPSPRITSSPSSDDDDDIGYAHGLASRKQECKVTATSPKAYIDWILDLFWNFFDGVKKRFYGV